MRNLVINNCELAGHTISKRHGLASFVRSNLSWKLSDLSGEDSDIEWQCINVEGYNIVNIYKPPTLQLILTSLPVFNTPCIYAGDFNCQHTDWGYNNISPDGECLSVWAANNDLTFLQDPKGNFTFYSRHWKSETNPDLAFARIETSSQPPIDEYLEGFHGHNIGPPL